MKKHIIAYILVVVGILLFYKFVIFHGVEPEKGKVEITATAIQNTISAGVMAVSILLPITVGILGYTLRQNRKGGNKLFCACIFFTISLAAALLNLFRIPGIVNVYNLANDYKTAFYEIIQLFSLFWGVFYLVWGTKEIIKN